MRRKIRLLATTFGWALLLALPASAAASNTTACTGELAPGSYGDIGSQLVVAGSGYVTERSVTATRARASGCRRI